MIFETWCTACDLDFYATDTTVRCPRCGRPWRPRRLHPPPRLCDPPQLALTFNEDTAARPLYLVNKANQRVAGLYGKTAAPNARGRVWGGKQWDEVVTFERILKHHATRARKDVPGYSDRLAWPTDQEYAVHIYLRFGDRIQHVKGTAKRRPHVRRERADRRCRAYGVDSVKAILDALQGPVYDDDEMITSLHVEKTTRPFGVVGDEIEVRVFTELLAPIDLPEAQR